MEMVELRSRAELNKDAEDVEETPEGTAPKKKGQSRKFIVLIACIERVYSGVTAAGGSKAYILRSTLHPTIIEHAALTDAGILEAESEQVINADDEEEPQNYGSIISWSTTEELQLSGILYVVLTLILVSGRVITDSTCLLGLIFPCLSTYND